MATQVYRTTDWGGWIVLAALAAVFLATGFSIRLALANGRHPVQGDAALLLAGLVALAWAGCYYSLRVSAHVVVAPDNITLVHGPWRHQIAWNDVARVDEWTELQDGVTTRWLALWSLAGMRLQFRSDLAANFAAFRADVLARLAVPRDLPAGVLDLGQPLTQAEDLSAPLGTWGAAMATLFVAGALVLVFLRAVTAVGIVLLALGAVCLGVAVALQALRQVIRIGPEGVAAMRGPLHTAIPWAAVYALDRERGAGLGGVGGILTRGLVLVVFRLDRRSGVLPAPARPGGEITIRGGSGQLIHIRERNYRHPEWLRARLRAEVEALRAAAAPLAPQVAPLPTTGPLAPGAVLPPDPLAGSSTLWLRESAEVDPFRVADRQG